MSREQHLELVKRLADAWQRRDIDAVMEYCDADVELLLARNLVEGGSYRGIDGLKRALTDTLATWEETGYEREDIRAIGDYVVSLGRGTVVGKRGTPTVDYQQAWVFELHQGKVNKIRTYMSHAEALEAVGLSG